MKKDYVRPTMVGEEFVPEEFVSACGYILECDIPRINNAAIDDTTAERGYDIFSREDKVTKLDQHWSLQKFYEDDEYKVWHWGWCGKEDDGCVTGASISELGAMDGYIKYINKDQYIEAIIFRDAEVV